MLIDLSAPAFFNAMRTNTRHMGSAYLMTLAALMHGLNVSFFRNQREAGLKNPLFPAEVTEPIFYSVSNAYRTLFFNGTQSERTSLSVSDVSAHGTVLRDCVVECLRLIFTAIGVEDDEETHDDEGACRAGR